MLVRQCPILKERQARKVDKEKRLDKMLLLICFLCKFNEVNSEKCFFEMF